MKRFTITILVSALFPLLAAPAGAHAPWKHREQLRTPLLHHIGYLRTETNRILASKCRSQWHIFGPLRSIRVNRRVPVRDTWARRWNQARAASGLCNDVGGAIAHYFGPYAGQARVVAECESTVGPAGLYAVNGQYVGVFQMGEWERSTYGWYTVGAPAYVQVRSAWNYFRASGRDWSPWACKPW